MRIVDHESYVSIYADEGRGIRRVGTTDAVESVNAVKGDESNWEDCSMDVIRYSVRKIIGELKTAGKFAAVRSLLETQKETLGYDWLFVGSNYLASDDADFQAICSAIVQSGIMTQAELDEMLAKCLWEQTPMN